MTRLTRLLAAASVMGLVAFGATPAFAAGTAAGSSITNNASVDYKVGGVSQTQIVTSGATSATFTVDRKIALTVTRLDAAGVTVVPGQTNAMLTYRVTNNSNATLDFNLAAAQMAGGAAPEGTDNFNANAATNTFTICVNGAGGDNVATFTAAGATCSTSGSPTAAFLDDIAADGAKTVFVFFDIPAAQVNNDIAGVVLTATGLNPGAADATLTGAGVHGIALVNTTTANTAGMDTVFADTAGFTDAVIDAKHSAADDYIVKTATLAVNKVVSVIWDPINGTTNPKAIPGAIVEYCIVVANSGGATATNITVNDTVPATTKFDLAPDHPTVGAATIPAVITTTGIAIDATVTGSGAAATCAGGANGGTYTAASTLVNGVVGGAGLASGSSTGLRFRAVIQ